MIDLIITPFLDFAFMRRALLGCIAISIGATPIGVFLMLRRMSLTGDAMAHAILPAAAARFWAQGIAGMISVAILVAVASSITGLLLSYHASLPTGPAIILVAGAFYATSVIFGPQGSLTARYLPRPHLQS